MPIHQAKTSKIKAKKELIEESWYKGKESRIRSTVTVNVEDTMLVSVVIVPCCHVNNPRKCAKAERWKNKSKLEPARSSSLNSSLMM